MPSSHGRQRATRARRMSRIATACPASGAAQEPATDELREIRHGTAEDRPPAPLLAGEPVVGTGYARSWRRVRPPERGHSLRTERLRYTLWPDGSEELYERRGSDVEAQNLAARPSFSAEKARLRARLEALVARSPS